MEKCTAYISKTNANCETHMILLMIPKEERKAGITL